MKSTTCYDCKIEFEYKTKKPKLCPKCHEERYGKRKFYNQPKGVITKSKGEFFLNKILDSMLPDASCIDGGYYSFLKSPKGYNMQLDRYYPRLHIAFEYDGSQHSNDNEYFYKNEDQLEYRKQCDTLKDELCMKYGITIIRISHTDYICKELIVKKLKALNVYDSINSKTKLVL